MTLIRQVQCSIQRGKIPLSRPHMRWEDQVKSDVDKLKPRLINMFWQWT